MGAALAIPAVIGGFFTVVGMVNNHNQQQHHERQQRQLQWEFQQEKERIQQMERQLQADQAEFARRGQEIAQTRARMAADTQRQAQEAQELQVQQGILEQQEAQHREVAQQLEERRAAQTAQEEQLTRFCLDLQERERRFREDRERVFPEPEWLLDVPVPRFAVTGEAGSGKSSFMNRLRGISDNDVANGAARVGAVGETTMEAQRYEIPHRPGQQNAFAGVSVFDLPGMGTLRQPEVTYVSRQGLLHFNGLVIFHKDRVKTSDIGLFLFARRNGLHWYVVRNQIDLTMVNDHRATGNTPDQTLELVKAATVENYLEGIHADPMANPLGYDDETLRQQIGKRVFCLSCYPEEDIAEDMRPVIRGEWTRFLRRVMRDLEHQYEEPVLAPGA